MGVAERGCAADAVVEVVDRLLAFDFGGIFAKEPWIDDSEAVDLGQISPILV